MHPANKLPNIRRRVNRARNRPGVTCPASRHVHMMADCLSMGLRRYPMLQEEPEHCAGALYAVIEELWKLRAEMRRELPDAAGKPVRGIKRASSK